MQIYQQDLVSSVLTPVKRLIAFTHGFLEPGQTEEMSISLAREDFALINAAGKSVVEPGQFRILAGFSSKDEDLTETMIRLS